MTADTGGAGLATPAARVAIIAVWATGILHSVISGSFPVLGVGFGLLVYGIALVGAVLVTAQNPGPLRRAAALSVIGCIVLLSLAVLAFADIAEAPAAQFWLLNFASYLGALTVARGNSVLGAVGTGLLFVLVIVWAVGTGQDAGGVIEMLTVPLNALMLGYTWLVVVTVIVRRERQARSEAMHAHAVAEAVEAADDVSRRELAGILRMATPSLTAIADGGRMDEERVQELVVVEGAIRDRIRAAELYHPLLSEAVRSARRTGAHVLLLGAEEASADVISDELAWAIARRIATADAETITIRSLGARRAGAVSMLLVGQGGEADRVLLDADGQPVNGQISGT